jgi:hypothetical protein
MRSKDLSWRLFGALQVGLFAAHVFAATVLLGKPLTAGLKSYAVALWIIGGLFALALRTVRSGATLLRPANPHHPRFPAGKHPVPRLQFSIGMFVLSALLLLMFWPWGPRS